MEFFSIKYSNFLLIKTLGFARASAVASGWAFASGTGSGNASGAANGSGAADGLEAAMLIPVTITDVQQGLDKNLDMKSIFVIFSLNFHLKSIFQMNPHEFCKNLVFFLKRLRSVISNDPSCREGNPGFTMPLKL